MAGPQLTPVGTSQEDFPNNVKAARDKKVAIDFLAFCSRHRIRAGRISPWLISNALSNWWTCCLLPSKNKKGRCSKCQRLSHEIASLISTAPGIAWQTLRTDLGSQCERAAMMSCFLFLFGIITCSPYRLFSLWLHPFRHKPRSLIR